MIERFGNPIIMKFPGVRWCAPDVRWVCRELEFVELPYSYDGGTSFLRVLFHKSATGLLRNAWEAATYDCPDYQINWAYGWSPRKIRNQVNGPLSMHAYGLAIDINPGSNKLRHDGDMPSGFVEAFERHGFRWGGHWATKDPMHFEVRL